MAANFLAFWFDYYYYYSILNSLRETYNVRQISLDVNHRLNMELDLQSLFGLLCTAVLIG
jgi:hypothetical protein